MKKLLSFVAAVLFAATSFAQVDEVTLTTIGTGQNEEQATLQALRSAIEQSFGTFVSANTTILNDKLVQDEIVSVSNGNVKEYQKLAVATMPNGQVSVSAKVTVSVNKLITYAKSKGSSAEFAGSTYAMNVKLIKLKASSTKKAYDLMMEQLHMIAKDMFSFDFQIIGDPKLCNVKNIGNVYGFKCKVNIMSNVASTNYYNLYYKTIENLKLSKEEVQLCINNNIEIVDVTESHRFPNPNSDDYSKRWVLPISLEYFRACKERMGEDIYTALHRYKIQEIGNPSNSYEYMICGGRCMPICIVINEMNRVGSKGDYQLYSNKWHERIFSYGHNKKNILRNFIENWSDSEENIKEFLSKFALTEVRTPIKLSKKEQNMVKKGTYTGPTYTTSYSNPKVIYTHDIYVAIPTNSIETFKGFELKY